MLLFCSVFIECYKEILMKIMEILTCVSFMIAKVIKTLKHPFVMTRIDVVIWNNRSSGRFCRIFLLLNMANAYPSQIVILCNKFAPSANVSILLISSELKYSVASSIVDGFTGKTFLRL